MTMSSLPPSSSPVSNHKSVGESKPEVTPASDHNGQRKTGIRRLSLSFRLFASTQAQNPKPASVPATVSEKAHNSSKLANGVTVPHPSRSDRRALKSALVVRSLIVGPASAASQATTALTIPQLKKVESQLRKPKTANRVIAQLRCLPTVAIPTSDSKNDSQVPGPIRAVCLEHSDDEMHDVHFSTVFDGEDDGFWSLHLPNVSLISLSKLTALFNQMHIIDLIQAPDLGLGQPAGEPGLLAGAVPTAETVMQGMQQLTPQLMALGYATGQAISPDHTGVYPPKDRMSILTYWWGLELVLPPSSLAHLSRVQSIPNTIINFLTALSLMNNGVREILPFVRYIAQFIDFQFKSILGQNRGKGVVCAATWIMPAAMVPRPWDFADPPGGTQTLRAKAVAAGVVVTGVFALLPSSDIASDDPTTTDPSASDTVPDASTIETPAAVAT